MSSTCNIVAHQVCNDKVEQESGEISNGLTSVASIDQQANAVVDEIREEESAVVHTVTVHGEGLVDFHVARRKCSV